MPTLHTSQPYDAGSFDVASARLKQIHYGQGSIKRHLLESVRDAKSVFILSSGSLANKTSVVKDIETLLGSKHKGTFSKLGQHTPWDDVLKAVNEAKRVNADAVVAVGGGSVIDGAKSVTKFFYVDPENQTPTDKEYLPLVAIPTTLSAAEFTQAVGVSYPDKETGNISKEGYADAKAQPTTIILDPEITIHTPEHLWLSTGIRAIDHAVESLYNPHPIQDSLSLSAIGELVHLLPLSKKNPNDLATRGQLQLAAWKSLYLQAAANVGFTLQSEKDLPGATSQRKPREWLSHTVSKRIGAAFNIGHGVSSCLCLPETVKFVVDEEGGKGEVVDNLAKISIISLGVGPNTGKSSQELAYHAADQIKSLIESLGLESRLSQVNISEKDVKLIADRSVARAGKEGYQVDSDRAKQLETLLRKML